MLIRRRRPRTPGDILSRHYLKPRKVSQIRFAEAAGLSRKHISQIIRGQAGVTAETAVRFATVLGTTPQFWLNLQNSLDLYEAGQAVKTAKTKPKRLAFPPPEGSRLDIA
jgi:addiction module HigA family antidote